MVALLAQHEVHLLHQMAMNNCPPLSQSSSSVTVNIGALYNALATAIGQAASPAQQVTASTSTTPSTTEASSSR